MTLNDLGLKHHTDKASSHHDYCKVYEQYFKHLQQDPIKFVEIGYGGYEYRDRGGAGLKMWREYFTQAEIHCIELHQKIHIPANCEFHCMSQDDDRVATVCAGAHIVIDDASHINPLTLKTFQLVWPVLAPGGIYVIEDIESSWCPVDGWASGCDNPLNHEAPTAANIGKHLVNDINAQYIPHFTGKYTDVESVHFHKNLLIIKKK
jgi:hypothetical protein